MIDTEKVTSESDVICLTQTHEKWQLKVNMSDHLVTTIDSVTELQHTKRGRCVNCLWLKWISGIEAKECMIKDLLYVKGPASGISVHKVVVYFAMNDKERNNRMMKEIIKKK